MEVTEGNLTMLGGYCEQTLSPVAEVRRGAEQWLKAAEAQQGYAICLLKLIEASANQPAIQQIAAVLFKNYVKTKWEKEPDEAGSVPMADKNVIKTHLVSLMCSQPDQIQKQLSAALGTIGEYDFPAKWENLLPELVSKLNGGDWRVINGVLLTANTIFKRFRNVFKTDELYRELSHCLEKFQTPLLELYKYARTSLVQSISQGSKADVITILGSLRIMSRIFYSLNWQDLPEYFEDHMPEWMESFQALLQLDIPLINDPDEEDEPSSLDYLHVAILENLNLYAEKYDEEFQKYLKTFTEMIWTLLSSKISLTPKHDMLAAKCMHFLQSISQQGSNHALFSSEAVLTEICRNIVVKNLTLRQCDEELFEDNPMDYIRRDIEGSDSDTRRSAARELIRGLVRNPAFRKPITSICLTIIQDLLGQYTSNPQQNWPLKDVSINLVIALGALKSTATRGVTEMNPEVPILDFFTTHIVPELSSASTSNLILKADGIKFVSTFRNQLNVEMMQQLMPMLINYLVPECFVVHTYAAACIERLLTVKDPSKQNAIVFGRPQLSPFLGPVLTGVFGILEGRDYPENDYLMKMVMRVMNVAKEDILPFTELAVGKLTCILKKTCANPSNPTFSHYLFEALSVLVLNVCRHNPSCTAQFEECLFPPFQGVLTADIESLSPYVYQVLALLLELNATNNISPAYMSLLPVLMTPALWDQLSNVPAIIKLIQAYLIKNGDQVIMMKKNAILGVFQKLISSRITEKDSFELIRFIFLYVNDWNILAQEFPELIRIMMTRLQSRMPHRNSYLYIKQLVVTLSVFVAKHGSQHLFHSLEVIQEGMSKMLLQDIWLPCLFKIRDKSEQKVCAVALTRLICETPESVPAEIWPRILSIIMNLIEDSVDKENSMANASTPNNIERDEELSDLKETGYEAGFSKLYFASASITRDLSPSVQSAKSFLVQSLHNLSTKRPQTYSQMAQQHLQPNVLSTLQNYFAQSNLTFL